MVEQELPNKYKTMSFIWNTIFKSPTEVSRVEFWGLMTSTNTTINPSYNLRNHLSLSTGIFENIL